MCASSIDSGSWEVLNRLLDAALDLPPAERGRWLDELPQEYEGVKPRLRDLLSRAEASDGFSSIPKMALEVSSEDDDAREAGAHAEGDLVGPYRLVRLVATGGMGTVWLAERSDGLIARPVALKLPLLARGHGAFRERIAREREILAGLNHPNIARLYDAGVSPDGQPYLALEYVEGRLIDRHCEEEGLDLEARLRLFLQVARAVAHAHEHSVVHRDIKPSNVLVTADGQARLLDFGIAKLLEGGFGPETQLTKMVGRAFTPDYASPEQIRGDPVTAASDVYSLGVLLYEMLTGSKPYRLKRASPGALEDAILEADPRKPSITAIDRRRARSLSGDLDTIVLRALRKRPEERFPTVHDLIDDIERHLDGRPVRSRPDALLYRAGKFVRRRRHALAAMLILATVSAIAVRSSAMRKSEAIQRGLADAQLAAARGLGRDALRTVDAVLLLDPTLPDARLLRARLLIDSGKPDRAAEEARKVLARDPTSWPAHLVLAVAGRAMGGTSIDEHLRFVESRAGETAEAYYLRSLVAESREAVPLLDRAIELDPGYVQALVARINRLTALKDFRAALPDCDRLMAARPRSALGRRMRARVYRAQHDTERALAEIQKAIELDPQAAVSYNLRAAIAMSQDRKEAALRDHDRAIELDPENEGFYLDRAGASIAAGVPARAIEDARRALAINPQATLAYYRLFETHLRLGHRDDAREVALELERTIGGWTEPKARVAAQADLSRFYLALGEVERARAAADAAVALDAGAVSGYLARAQARFASGDVEGGRGDCSAAAGVEIAEPERLRERGAFLGNVCGRWDLAVADFTRAQELAPGWAEPYLDRFDAYTKGGDFERAVADISRCVELAPRWTACYQNRLIAYLRLGRYEAALADCDELSRLAPESAAVHLYRANVLVGLGRGSDALREIERSIELDPRDANLYSWRAELSVLEPGACRRAAEDLKKAAELAPASPETLHRTAWVNLAAFYYACPDAYDPAGALAAARRAVEMRPTGEDYLRTLGLALYRNGKAQEALDPQLRSLTAHGGEAKDLYFLAMEHEALGKKKDARSYLERAVAWTQTHAPRDPALARFRAEAEDRLGGR
jgi:serine/threonine protein kinase/tetratricopeptide (TPR) repeat protein